MTIAALEARYIQACKAENMGLAARLSTELDAAGKAETERLEAPGALKSAALWYAKQGIAVFPLIPRDKKPLTTHGFKDATTAPETVRSWWDATPTANIGTPTGHLFDVIDIDGPEGVRSWLGFMDSLPPLIGKAHTARAGGFHLYIKAVPGRTNKAGLFPSVDYRALGGYVVLPPSIGANLQRYIWVQPLELA